MGSSIQQNDEAIDLARYKQAADEVNSGSRDEALWYKAFAEASGDEQSTKAAYIRLRVEQLRRAAVAASAVRVTATQSNPAVKQSPPSATTLRNNQTPANSLYSVLGVVADATDEQISEAYRKKKAELDSQDNQDTEIRNRLSFIKHAATMLLDPAKRAQYDARIATEAAQPAKAQTGAAKTITNNAADEPAPLEQHDLYRAYLGEKNADYYLEKFAAFDREGDGLHASWNWAAFLVNGLWFLYRKMYGWFFVCWGVATISNISIAHNLPWLGFVSFVSWLALTAYANSLYHKHVKKKIAAVTTRPELARNRDALLANLQRQGGVNSWVVWVFLAIFVIGILAAILIPVMSGKSKTQPAVERPTVEQPAAQSLAGSTASDWVKLVCVGTGGTQVVQFNESTHLVIFRGEEYAPRTMDKDRITFGKKVTFSYGVDTLDVTLDRVSGKLETLAVLDDGGIVFGNYTCTIAQNKF